MRVQYRKLFLKNVSAEVRKRCVFPLGSALITLLSGAIFQSAAVLIVCPFLREKPDESHFRGRVISPRMSIVMYLRTSSGSSKRACKYISFVTVPSTVQSYPLITPAVFSW